MGKRKKDKPIFVADCETDPFEKGRVPVPFLWGVYDGSNYEEFTETAKFIEYISAIECIVYAHNGGKFDWHFITDFIEYGTDLMIINGRLASFVIGEAEFRDSYNILPVPLAAMQKTKIDYALFEVTERHKPQNWKLITDYLYDDCRFLFDYVQAFIDRFGLHLTLAGCALKTWEKVADRKAPKDEGGFIYENFSRYYYGGRCQAFAAGLINHDCAMVDLNSAYPFAMLRQHPIGLEWDDIEADEFNATQDIPGDWFLTVECAARGAFPLRSDDGGLTFPNDGIRRVFHITGWEYNAAKFTGHIDGLEFLQGYAFRELVDFQNFILPLYAERLACKAAGDKRGDLLAKLCMNSCYGKFASDPSSYRKYRAADPDKFSECTRNTVLDGVWTFGGFFGELGLLEKPLNDAESRYYNVCTSASITGFVRALLWKSLCQCEGVLYCDTDSIVAFDVSALSTGNELGEWKIEAAFTHGGIAGKKLYAFEGWDGVWKHAAKGARLEPAQVMTIAKGGVVCYEPDAPTFSVHNQPRFVNRVLRATNKIDIPQNNPLPF